MATHHHQLAAPRVLSIAWSSPWSSPPCLSLCYTGGSVRTPHRPLLRLIVVASASSSAGDTGAASSDDDESDAKVEVGDDAFEERLAKLRRRSRSGAGTKAEKRKGRQSGDYVSLSAPKRKGGDAVLLPPVPLQDPLSDGLRVELGFNSYTERINGRFAALGLAAILLVELATGGSFFKYHESSIIGIQAYFMLAISAVFIKYEKEKISIWPKS